jgi:hypothetical protein
MNANIGNHWLLLQHRPAAVIDPFWLNDYTFIIPKPNSLSQSVLLITLHFKSSTFVINMTTFRIARQTTVCEYSPKSKASTNQTMRGSHTCDISNSNSKPMGSSLLVSSIRGN